MADFQLLKAKKINGNVPESPEISHTRKSGREIKFYRKFTNSRLSACAVKMSPKSLLMSGLEANRTP